LVRRPTPWHSGPTFLKGTDRAPTRASIVAVVIVAHRQVRGRETTVSVRLIEVRQPRNHDVVGRSFVIAGYGAGFEGTVVWRLLDEDRHELGKGLVKGVGSMDVLSDFGHEVTLGGTVRERGAHVLLQVFGDDPSGRHPPGPDLNEVRVTLFTDLTGWKLYEVKSGDTLTKIVREQGRNTSVDDVFAANRDKIINPDKIFPGQVFRVPLRG
jgi:hypothetical protein